MGNCRSVLKRPQLISDEEVDQLAKRTGFTHKQILRLHLRFMALDKGGKGVLDRDDFFNIPDLEMNPLGDRIIDAFFAEASDPEKRLTFPEFVTVLAHFRPCNDPPAHEQSANDHHTHDALTNNSREEKLKFAFAMYDLNKNGFITKSEFKVILNMMVGANITTEQLNSITDRTITEGDFEHNGKISFQEFCRVRSAKEHKVSWLSPQPNRNSRLVYRVLFALHHYASSHRFLTCNHLSYYCGNLISSLVGLRMSQLLFADCSA